MWVLSGAMAERRIAVCDLGSNSFRLVVFTAANGWWRRTDEIHEAVRIGAVAPAPELSVSRLSDRRGLLERIDGQRRRMDEVAEVQSLDGYKERAFRLLSSPTTARLIVERSSNVRSRSILPTSLRSVVCASCEMAKV